MPSQHIFSSLPVDSGAAISVCVFVCREMVQDVEELRRAVKQEAGQLEMQLNELADHYDDNLKRVTMSHLQRC